MKHFILISFALLTCLSPQLFAGLKGAADVTDITPLPNHFPISTAGSMRANFIEKTESRVHCRTIMIGNEETIISFTLVDSCLIPRGIADAAKRIASKKTGIPASNMTVAATHTHSAPTATPAFQSNPSVGYQIYLAEKIAESVAAAHSRLEPAEAGWAVGSDPSQVFNRRWFVKEPYANPFGQTTDKVRMNPGYNKGNGKVSKPAGPVDPDVPVFAIRSSRGEKKPIALLANYALHYVGNPPRSSEGKAQFSGDYFAAFAEIMAEKAAPGDGDYVAILSNGASGDINNVNYAGPPPPRREPGEQIRIVAASVAAAAFAAFQKIEYKEDFPIATVARELKLGVRKADEAGLKRALDILSAPQRLINGNLSARDAIYARETLQLREYPDTVPVRLQAVRLGDLCILTTPCETFAEIGLELKELSPFTETFPIELANGYNGYLPTPQQHEWGGYETWRAKSSYLENDASIKVVDAFREMMIELHGKP